MDPIRVSISHQTTSQADAGADSEFPPRLEHVRSIDALEDDVDISSLEWLQDQNGGDLKVYPRSYDYDNMIFPAGDGPAPSLRSRKGHKYNYKTMRGICRNLDDTAIPLPIFTEACEENGVWAVFDHQPRRSWSMV